MIALNNNLQESHVRLFVQTLHVVAGFEQIKHFYNNLFLALKYTYVSSALLAEKLSSFCLSEGRIFFMAIFRPLNFT